MYDDIFTLRRSLGTLEQELLSLQTGTLGDAFRRAAAAGAPSRAGRSVRSAPEAWKVAQEIGVPVVVKPDLGNQGKGVSVDLTTAKQVEDAYQVAREFWVNVLVEKYLEGEDYRLLVVNGKMVAARRDPAQVVGDGTRAVPELVEVVNRDPR